MIGHERRWRLALERRSEPKGLVWYRLISVVVGLGAGLLVSMGLAQATPSDLLNALWLGTFGTGNGLGNVATLATPLIFMGLAAAVPYRIGMWNIGAEGQLLLGGWGAAAVGFALPSAPGPLLIALMLAAAAVAGAAWIALPALARAYLGVNEIITTLLANFVASFWALYWAGTVWLEPASAGFVKSRPIPPQSDLPSINVTSTFAVPVGLLIALGAAGAVWFYLNKTVSGYEIDLIGASERVGRYAGIATKRRLVSAMLLGGALAGIGGAVELLGNTQRYGLNLSNNTGYTGVVIAVLVAGSALGVVAMAIVFAGLFVCGDVLTVLGTSSDVVFAITGLILVLAGIGQGLAHVRFVRTRHRRRERHPVDGSRPAAAGRDGPRLSPTDSEQPVGGP